MVTIVLMRMIDLDVNDLLMILLMALGDCERGNQSNSFMFIRAGQKGALREAAP